MAYKATHFEDSDADDEYERSLVMSPTLPPDFDDASPTDSGPLSAEHTPTTFTHSRDSNGSPAGMITDWSEEQCADFVSSLGLPQYADTFKDNGIIGDALVALQHADLKDMGLSSVGHRLTILKAVYEVKVKQNVPIEPDHYVPLSADTAAQDAPPTQEDFEQVIRIIKARDERLHVAETELRLLKEDLNRVMEENRKLREEFLPLARRLKDSQQPLPTPQEQLASPPVPQGAVSNLQRKFSTKKLFLSSSGVKNPSPTLHEGRQLLDNSSLDPSAAATAASQHLTASMTGGAQMSPNSAPQPSPTSPAYSSTQNNRFAREHENQGGWSNGTNGWAGASDRENRDMRNPTPAPLISRPPLRSNNTAPSSDPSDRDRDPPLSGGGPPSAPLPPSSSTPGSSAPQNPQVEIFKSFRVSIDDPCHKVLPVALKKYNITADWRQYALYIVHGDQERCLGLNERPLILFKQLDKEGRKPMFMLRKHAAPIEGHVNTIGSSEARPVQGGSWDNSGRAMQLPGGVFDLLFTLHLGTGEHHTVGLFPTSMSRSSFLSRPSRNPWLMRLSRASGGCGRLLSDSTTDISN